MSNIYKCEKCETEIFMTKQYSQTTQSIAEFCETCGHLTDFVDIDSDYWDQ